MSIIARIRPSVEVKRNRVTPAKPVAFGAGLIDDPKPIRLTPEVIHRLDEADAADAVEMRLASYCPSPEGRGLTRPELARITRAENAARREVERWAFGLGDHAAAQVVGETLRGVRSAELRAILRDRTPAVAPGHVDRHGVYHPSADESAWVAIEAARWDADARLDHEAHESAWMASYEQGLACV